MALNTLRVKRQNAIIISPTKRVRRFEMGRHSPGNSSVVLPMSAGRVPPLFQEMDRHHRRWLVHTTLAFGARPPGGLDRGAQLGSSSRAEAVRRASVSGPCWGPTRRDGFREFCGATDQDMSFTHSHAHSFTNVLVCSRGAVVIDTDGVLY